MQNHLFSSACWKPANSVLIILYLVFIIYIINDLLCQNGWRRFPRYPVTSLDDLCVLLLELIVSSCIFLVLIFLWFSGKCHLVCYLLP